MKNIIQCGVCYLLCLLMAHPSFCQTETFDISTYTPPAGWIKNMKPGAVTYSIVDNTKGTFCVLAIYTATASKGTPQKDFASEWATLVATPFITEANPKTGTQTTADGWKAVVGAAMAMQGNNKFSAILTVFSGYGKAASVLITLNDQFYMTEANALLDNIKLDKKAVIIKSNITTQNTQVENNSTSIIGVWSDHAAAIGNYVTSSGAFIGSADVNTMEEYTFKTDNTYIYKFFGMSNGKLYYTETNGSYTTSGKNLSLTPLTRKGGYSGDIHDEKSWLDKPGTFYFYIGPNKWEAGPFLNLHKDGNYYANADYPYNYYKKIQK